MTNQQTHAVQSIDRCHLLCYTTCCAHLYAEARLAEARLVAAEGVPDIHHLLRSFGRAGVKAFVVSSGRGLFSWQQQRKTGEERGTAGLKSDGGFSKQAYRLSP